MLFTYVFLRLLPPGGVEMNYSPSKQFFTTSAVLINNVFYIEMNCFV